MKNEETKTKTAAAKMFELAFSSFSSSLLLSITRMRTRTGLFGQFRARQIHGEGRAGTHLGVDMQRAVGLLDEPLDDVEAEAGALTRTFGGEIRLENFRQQIRRNARTGVAHPESHQRRFVAQVLQVQAAVVRAVLECRQFQRGVQNLRAHLNTMRLRQALKRVDRE